jgi:CRP-like cAMP-binding protein
MSTVSSDVLGRVPLLSGLDARQLTRLAQAMRERTFPKGTEATREGGGGVGFFIVLEGSASVSVQGEARRSLGPNDWFGEIALLSDDGLRTATVTAETDLRCVGLTAWEFKPFLQENPEIAWRLLQTMAARVAAE